MIISKLHSPTSWEPSSCPFSGVTAQLGTCVVDQKAYVLSLCALWTPWGKHSA